MLDLTAVIITKNEEKNIARCLDSLNWASEIIIVDDFSTDKTKEIALKHHNVRFFENKFIDFSQQRNFAVSKINSDWILSLDADEVISVELQKEIFQVIKKNSFTAYNVPTKNVFWGKWLKHGGWYPNYHIRLFKKLNSHWEGEANEKVNIKGEIGYLKNPILHIGQNTIEESFSKILRDVPLESKRRIGNGIKFSLFKLIFDPMKVFISRYFLKAGFTDGIAGLGAAFLMACYQMLVWLKMWETDNNK